MNLQLLATEVITFSPEPVAEWPSLYSVLMGAGLVLFVVGVILGVTAEGEGVRNAGAVLAICGLMLGLGAWHANNQAPDDADEATSTAVESIFDGRITDITAEKYGLTPRGSECITQTDTTCEMIFEDASGQAIMATMVLFDKGHDITVMIDGKEAPRASN